MTDHHTLISRNFCEKVVTVHTHTVTTTKENMPEKCSQMSVGATETEEDAKKRQKRGGKGVNIISFSNNILISRNFFNNYQQENYLI